MGLPDGPPLSDEQLRPLTAQVRASGTPVCVTAPFTGADLALVPQGTADDVAAAVARARAAQQAWAATPPAARAAWARRLATAAGQRRDEVIDLVQWETGKARLVYRDYPIGALALRAAALASCMEGDAYFGFLDALFQRGAVVLQLGMGRPQLPRVFGKAILQQITQ